jgi:hypothetical protein
MLGAMSNAFYMLWRVISMHDSDDASGTGDRRTLPLCAEHTQCNNVAAYTERSTEKRVGALFLSEIDHKAPDLT